jgi:predicted RNA binding protein YcfA (HicA-like mRNA interferase family)
MSRKEKLIKRLLSKPTDFTWSELLRLLKSMGFVEEKKGKTGGSRRRFTNDNNVVISLHKPHPSNTLKGYQVTQIIETLKQEGLL